MFVVDLVTIPLFSAFAGLITNWTGVLMLFAPAQFTGFYVPGLRRVFPFLPRKVQILPIFAPNGILGFQGFIPCRAEKMSSLVVDKTIARIGRIEDFYTQLEPERLAARLADAARPEIRRLTIEIIERDHADLWRTLPNIAREKVLRTVDAELTTISRHAFATIGDNIDELLDVKLMTVNYLRRHPELLRDIIKGMAVPELKFMVRSGALGLPLGVVLALVLSFAHYAHLPLPGWLIVVAGAALIGVVVNVIAIKVVFEPGEPRPRYRYLWRQGLFARRQHEAAAQLSAMLATKVLTVANFSHELFHGAHGERTLALIGSSVSAEVDRDPGPVPDRRPQLARHRRRRRPRPRRRCRRAGVRPHPPVRRRLHARRGTQDRHLRDREATFPARRRVRRNALRRCRTGRVAALRARRRAGHPRRRRTHPDLRRLIQGSLALVDRRAGQGAGVTLRE